MVEFDRLVWLLVGLVVGQGIGYALGHLRSSEAIKIAKMRLVAESGRDPLLVEAMEKTPEVVAPAPADDLEALNRKVRERYGEDYEVL